MLSCTGFIFHNNKVLICFFAHSLSLAWFFTITFIYRSFFIPELLVFFWRSHTFTLCYMGLISWLTIYSQFSLTFTPEIFWHFPLFQVFLFPPFPLFTRFFQKYFYQSNSFWFLNLTCSSSFSSCRNIYIFFSLYIFSAMSVLFKSSASASCLSRSLPQQLAKPPLPFSKPLSAIYFQPPSPHIPMIWDFWQFQPNFPWPIHCVQQMQ